MLTDNSAPTSCLPPLPPAGVDVARQPPGWLRFPPSPIDSTRSPPGVGGTWSQSPRLWLTLSVSGPDTFTQLHPSPWNLKWVPRSLLRWRCFGGGPILPCWVPPWDEQCLDLSVPVSTSTVWMSLAVMGEHVSPPSVAPLSIRRRGRRGAAGAAPVLGARKALAPRLPAGARGLSFQSDAG